VEQGTICIFEGSEKVKHILERYRAMVDDSLKRFVRGYKGIPAELKSGIMYALFPGGKRFRPLLFLSTIEALGGEAADFLPFACGIEMVHSFSLVHDDLPSMDNDYFRRGKPALHEYMGDGKALLVGDALLIMAFEVAMSLELYGDVDAELVIKASKELARASGASGMTGGQFLDVDVSKDGTDNELLLKWIHEHKTSALIRVSVLSAGIFLRRDDYLDRLASYGRSLGMLFQLVDDIMDVDSGEKSNYAELVGLEKALEEARRFKMMAEEELSFLGDKAGVLKYMVSYIFERGEQFVSLGKHKLA